MSIKNYFSNSLRALTIFILLTGLIYPLIIYAVGQIFFHDKANGSLLKINGEIRGSYLIGQKFESAKYFWPRPSSIDYNPLPSGASNLSLTSKVLLEQYKNRESDFINKNGLDRGTKIPSEMLFASASGVDPDISSEAAYLQVNRIVKAREFNPSQKKLLYKLIEEISEEQKFNFTGINFVNVLELNVKLDVLGKQNGI